jgi:hypothetical protein
MFAAQKVQTLVHPWVALGGFFFFGIRQQCSYQLQKIAYTYRGLQCSRANLKRYCKIPFSVNQKKQQPRIKTQSSSTQACFFSPNSLMTTFIFRKTMAISLLLRGNALARIV